MGRGVVIGLLVVLAVGCGGSNSPTTPKPPVTPLPPPSAGGQIVSGFTSNALDGSPAATVSFTVGGTFLGQSGADGAFTAGFHESGLNRTVLAGAGFVTRETGIVAPGSNLRLSLIPSSFNLTAFNQMFRHAAAGLTRWTSPPALVVERRVLQFTTVNAGMYEALDESLSTTEADEIIADMQSGYSMLTDGRLGPLAAVSTEMADAGDPVAPGQDRRIVVTRQKGLTAATGFWGYARWATTADGEVTSGFIILDRDFEVSGSPFRRSLRMHELGHTLGGQHVTGTPSVMNSNARTEPNSFDHQAARLAMLRPIGNRPPDIDPASHTATTVSRAPLALVWHGAH